MAAGLDLVIDPVGWMMVVGIDVDGMEAKWLDATMYILDSLWRQHRVSLW